MVKALHDRGFGPSQFENLFYCEMKDDFPVIPPHVEIRRVETEEDRADFLHAYLTGWDYPEKLAEIWREAYPQFCRTPGFTFYVAYIEGEIAACAQLQIVKNVGYFADAVTIPAFRRKGCQNAFFTARAEDAKRLGADILMSITEVNSQSAHNMENFGLRCAFNIMFWQRPEES